ncbi:MAG: hypothetical protein ACOC10_03370 [Bacteroidota bacterium]
MYFIPKYRRGVYNKYRRGMSSLEKFLKDANHFYLLVRNYFRNGFQHKTLLAHPHYPSRNSTIYKVAKKLGLNITNKPGKHIDLAIYWEYATIREEYHELEALADRVQVLNLQSRDISKVFVDDVFYEVFGYRTFVDPLTFKGKCVQKSDINAQHDGKVIDCPINKKEEGYIYQLLINNEVENDFVEDIRVPVVMEALPIIYMKYRTISSRFKNLAGKSRVEKIETVLTPEEISLINVFCKRIKLEYGEIDVLRNKDDGKIYIVDVNNTAQGPPTNIIPEDGKYSIDVIADYFKKAFLSN